MSQQTEHGVKSFQAGADLSGKEFCRVKLDSSGYVVLAGASEPSIGVLQPAASLGDGSGAWVPVRLFNAAGTFKMKAGAAITQFAQVTGIANGKIDDVTAVGDAFGVGIGIALEAATADGDVIEILPTVQTGLRIVMGHHTTVAASDTVVTGLASVSGCLAGFETALADATYAVQAVRGDQAGTPAAGSILIKTYKSDGTDPTPAAADAFSKLVSWIAWGK